MRTARLVLTPWLCKKSMISRICFASCHACAIRSWRFGPIPSTECNSDGRLSMTTRISAPKCPTSFLARYVQYRQQISQADGSSQLKHVSKHLGRSKDFSNISEVEQC